MSYVVHLWEEAPPANLQDADRLHRQLVRTPAAANPKFAQLARAVIERFPVEVGGRGGTVAEWVESPPDGQTDTRVYSLGLYEEGITLLLPVLVELATGLGLSVYDDRAGRAYLPGPWVVDAAGRHPLQAEPARPSPTVAQGRAMFKREVLPTLAKQGFKLVRHNLGFDFARQSPSGEQKLTVCLRDLDQALEVKPFTTVSPALPPCIAQAMGAGAGLIALFARQYGELQGYSSAAAPRDGPRYPEFLAYSEAECRRWPAPIWPMWWKPGCLCSTPSLIRRAWCDATVSPLCMRWSLGRPTAPWVWRTGSARLTSMPSWRHMPPGWPP
jgi:hypothetical protein